MKTTLLRLSRRAACLVLAGGLLTSCSLLPAASPRHEGTASSQAPQYYSDAWLSDDSLHYLYSYAGNGGGTILRGGRVLYKASSSDSIQLLKNTLTGETDHYLVAHSILGTEERTSTLYDADGNPVMTFPYAVNVTLSGGLLILRDDADVWASENGTTGGTRVYDLATGAQLPVPETVLDCLVVDEGGQRLVFNCYDLPEGLTYAYDDPDQKLHQYVLITDREGNVLMREDGCTASTLASYRGGFADWLDLSWFRSSDWGITREALYNVTTPVCSSRRRAAPCRICALSWKSTSRLRRDWEAAAATPPPCCWRCGCSVRRVCPTRCWSAWVRSWAAMCRSSSGAARGAAPAGGSARSGCPRCGGAGSSSSSLRRALPPRRCTAVWTGCRRSRPVPTA